MSFRAGRRHRLRQLGGNAGDFSIGACVTMADYVTLDGVRTWYDELAPASRSSCCTLAVPASTRERSPPTCPP